MARILINKKTENTRLAKEYGGWIYCDHCGENIGYLCYITYSQIYFKYKCKCGEIGCLALSFDDKEESNISKNNLLLVKNRLCCFNDKSPLLTILDKKLESYSYDITCVECNAEYRGGSVNE